MIAPLGEELLLGHSREVEAHHRDGRVLTYVAGFGLLASGVGLALDLMLLLASGLGTALGGSASSGLPVLCVTVTVVLIGAGAVVCGVLGGRRRRWLGWMWALLATPITCLGVLVLYCVVTSPSFPWG